MIELAVFFQASPGALHAQVLASPFFIQAPPGAVQGSMSDLPRRFLFQAPPGGLHAQFLAKDNLMANPEFM